MSHSKRSETKHVFSPNYSFQQASPINPQTLRQELRHALSFMPSSPCQSDGGTRAQGTPRNGTNGTNGTKKELCGRSCGLKAQSTVLVCQIPKECALSTTSHKHNSPYVPSKASQLPGKQSKKAASLPSRECPQQSKIPAVNFLQVQGESPHLYS